jgi:lactoylglutathione lyase
MTVRAIWHFSFHVGNLDRSIHFYTDLLGLRLVHQQDQSNAYTSLLVGYDDAYLRVAQLAAPDRDELSPSSHDLELIEYVRPRMDPLPVERARPGSSHLAFTVEDIDAEFRRLQAAGVQFVSAPNAITAGVNVGGACCYFLDPDGSTLELVQRPISKEQPSTP